MRNSAKFAVLAVAVAMLALAATALAGSKTIQQSGQIVGDKASSVKLRVKVKNGNPLKISGFAAKDIQTRCGGVVQRYKYSALSPIPVKSGKFDIDLVEDTIGLRITLKGKVKNSGKSVVGTLKTNSFQVQGASCKVPKQKFKTSAK